MPLTPINNPPAPVLEQVKPAIPPPEECAEIKAEFGLETGSHKDNESKKSREYQSHHVLQNAAVEPKGLVSHADGLAVLLGDSHGGTEHQTITGRQNERRDNKARGGGGTMPASNMGDLKKQARDDLAKGLEGKRPSKKTGKPMTKEEAEKAADCLVAEADKKLKSEAKKNGKKVDDKTQVAKPGGCLAAGTVVWLVDREARPVEDVCVGDLVHTFSGPQVVVRVDLCHHDLVELRVGGSTLTIASFHRLLLPDGDTRRADELRAGDRVATALGSRIVEATRPLGRCEPIYRVSFRKPAFCPIGSPGVWSFMPEAGPRMLRRESVESLMQETNVCPS